MVGRSQHTKVSFFPRLARRARPVAVISMAAALVLLAGCDKPSAQGPLQDAEQQFAVLTARGTNIGPIEADRKTKLNKLANDLLPLTREGDVQAPASVLASKAKSALATIAAQNVGDSAREMQIRLTELRAELSGYIVQSSQAEAASKFNIQTEGKALSDQLTQASSELTSAQQQASQVQATVAQLDSRLESLRASATAARDNASSLRAQISTVNAQQGLGLAQQAQQASLAADKLDTELALVSNDRTLAGYQLQQAQSRTTALEGQITRLKADIAAMTSQGQQMQTLAQSGRQAATTAAGNISQKFAALKQFRTEKLMAPLAEARKLADESANLAQMAVSKAQGSTAQAKADATTAAKLGLISAQQLQADLLNEQARLDESFAGTAKLLASAQPALSDAATYAAAAEEASKSYEESIKQAREMYTKLVESLQGISGEKYKSRITPTIAALEALASAQGVKAPAPMSATGSGTAPAAAVAGSPEAAVAALVDKFLDAMRGKDYPGMAALYDMPSGDARKAMINAMESLQRVADATKVFEEKFGADYMGPMGAGMGAMTGDATKMTEILSKRTAGDYTITLNADGKSGTVAAKQPTAMEAQPLKVALKDGQWVFEPSQQELMAFQMMGPMMGNLAKAFEEIAADVKSGKIEDKEQLQRVLASKLQGLMPGMGGGGGRGE